METKRRQKKSTAVKPVEETVKKPRQKVTAAKLNEKPGKKPVQNNDTAMENKQRQRKGLAAKGAEGTEKLSRKKKTKSQTVLQCQVTRLQTRKKIQANLIHVLTVVVFTVLMMTPRRLRSGGHVKCAANISMKHVHSRLGRWMMMMMAFCALNV
jgi:hypothetical protein